MTAAEAKKLITWMQDKGVLQFSYEGLSVQFHPNTVGKAKPKAKNPADAQAEAPVGRLERMFPPTGT